MYKQFIYVSLYHPHYFLFLCSLFFQRIIADVLDFVRKVRLFSSLIAIRKNSSEELFVILCLDSCIYTLENQVYFGTVMDEVMAALLKL